MTQDNSKAVTTTKKRQDIVTVQQTLEKMKDQLAMALPDHIKPERMIRVALTAIQNTPKLLDCDKNSFYLAVLRAAQLGLEPDGILGQAYLIPYGDTVQLIPGYKGLIDLARRSGEVSNIIAKEVCAKDTFELHWHEEVPFTHEQATSGDRGSVIGFWAMARFKDGGFHFDYMPLDEVTKIRDNSSGYKAAVSWSKNAKNKYTKGKIVSPWEDNFVEMGKKTAIRRIAKYLPMSVQRAAVIEDMVDGGRKFSVGDMGEILVPDDGKTIEGDAEVIDEGGSQLDEFAGADPANAKKQKAADTKESAKPEEPEADKPLTLNQWITEINDAPTAEGVQYKLNQATTQFAGDEVALNTVKNAADKKLHEMKK